MNEVVFDIETKKAFVEVGKYDPSRLGVSYVGVFVRERDLGENSSQVGELVGFFEDGLAKLWPILEQADRLVGFNIVGFDLPVLQPYYHGSFSDFPVLDILEEVKKEVGHRVSLDAIAKETLGVQKSGSGLDALTFYEQGEFDKLAEYCLGDVKITRDVYDYGLENRKLKFKNKWNRLVEVPVDFSYREDDGSKVQMSLGV